MASNIETLDTNIILRHIIEDNPKQYKITERLLNKKDTVFSVLDVAITETVYVMERTMNYSRTFITKSLYNFLNQPNITYSKDLFDEILPLYESHPALSFNDCYLSVLTARNQAEPLWTFDHKLAIQSPVAKEPR